MWFVAATEFKDLEGHLLSIVNALDGLRISGPQELDFMKDLLILFEISVLHNV